jgi:hypothetical protein
MVTQAVASVNCPNCRTPFTAPIQQIIDVQADPAAKSRLLSGQLNLIVCPHCGFQGALNAPFLYHDAELDLALVYMPMELGDTDMDRQKTIGDLTNRVLQQLPPESRKGYLLQPRTFLTVQSLIDAMLEEDAETRELVEAQRRKMELFEQLRQMDPEDRLAVAEFVGANDEELDASFFQLLELMISIAESQGDTAEHERLVKHEANLLEKSTTGRSFKAQREAVEALSANPTRETLIEQLVAAEDRMIRETLVTVGRQLLDYPFFQALTARIEAAQAAGDEAAHNKLIALRREVQEIRDDVDAAARVVLDERATLLRDLLLEDDPREMLMRRLMEVDDVFFGVLSTNILQAQREGRQEVVERLRNVGNVAVQLLNEFAPPEIKLVNQLASAENNEQVRQLLEAEREQLGQDLLRLVEQAAEDLQQGERHKEAERLRYATEQIKEMIGA